MKKTLIISIIAILTFAISITTVKTVKAEEQKFNISMEIQETPIDTKTQTQVVAKLKLDNYSGDGTLGYEGVLNYDKTVFESVNITSESSWDTPVYEASTGKFISTTTTATQGTYICKITLTLKQNITATNTNIEINDLTISDGIDEVKIGLTKNLTIKQETEPSNNTNTESNTNNTGTESDTNNNNDTTDNDNQEQETTDTDDTIKAPENNSEIKETDQITVEGIDNTQADTAIPQTGSGVIFPTIIVAVVVIGVFSYIKYYYIDK